MAPYHNARRPYAVKGSPLPLSKSEFDHGACLRGPPLPDPRMTERETISITLGDCAEGHTGMERLGQAAPEGFDEADLRRAQEYFESRGCECTLDCLNDQLPGEVVGVECAFVLFIRKGVNKLLSQSSTEDGGGADALIRELTTRFEWDKKARMRGRVVNKHARHNVCFGNQSQEADFEAGRGTVVAWQDVPMLHKVRNELAHIIGPKAAELKGEGNRYYDVTKCGIGFHGDSERKKVVALRLGAQMDIQWQWFHKSSPVGKRYVNYLGHGDMYIMSEKTVGYDWKRSSIHTLRHAAGSKKFTTITRKLKNNSRT
eukprot:GFYU01021801.1.p1 GENE.GFYU01021801.1~~GFYU01021801.1.p1  ORF type:complete len:339 (+),score=20.23 GFYU01021801.1:74-1018(+)